MTLTLNDWVEQYRLAWENRDDGAVVELFTPEATYRSNIFEEPHAGREQLRAYWQRVTSTQSDVQVRMGTPIGDAHRVAVEWWTTMRSDGEEITLPGCLLLSFDEQGLCTSLREYWQVGPGGLEPPAEWGW